MNEWDFLIPVVAIIFGTGLTAVFFGGIFSLIRTWMQKNKSDEDLQAYLIHEMNEFRYTFDKRLENLEAIVAQSSKEFESSDSINDIEIVDGYTTSEQNQKTVSNLTNDLRST